MYEMRYVGPRYVINNHTAYVKQSPEAIYCNLFDLNAVRKVVPLKHDCATMVIYVSCSHCHQVVPAAQQQQRQ